MVQHRQEMVIIENTPEDLKSFVNELDERLKNVEFNDTQVQEISAALERLAQHPFNQADGQVKALVGSYHFPLRRTLWTALALSLTFSGGLLAAFVDPVSGGVALGGTVIAAIQQAGDLFAKLTSDEIVVYRGLGEVLLEKRKAGHPEKATADEVQAFFDSRRQAIGNVANTLSNLREKGAVDSDVISDKTFFSLKA